jgi:hypothetical protein
MDQEVTLLLEASSQQQAPQQQQQQQCSSPVNNAEKSSSSISDNSSIVIRKDETESKITLRVTVPREVDAECATIATELFLDHLELLPLTASVKRIKIANLRFSKGGVGVMKSFVAIHANTVKHVSLHRLVHREASKLEKDTFITLAAAFEAIQLETLDLSHNALESAVWEAWSNQTSLDKLLLKDVEMDDASCEAMSEHFNSFKTISRMHVSNMRAVSEDGTASACRVVEKCSSLCSLRWATRDANSTPPLLGLKTLAFRGFQTKSGNLRRLEIEGGSVTGIIFKGGLCGAIECLNRLEHLNLRRLGLGPRGTMQVVAALKTAKAPLSYFDISENDIEDEGAVALAQLANQRSVMRNLKVLAVEKNGIGSKGAQTLLHIFAANSVALCLQGNPFDATAIAMSLVAENAGMRMNAASLEKDRARVQVELNLSKKQVRQLTSEQTTLLGKINSMEKEIRRLTDERDSLSRALSSVGGTTTSNVDERVHMLERLAKLEALVLGAGGRAEMAESRPRRTPAYNRSRSEIVLEHPLFDDNDNHSMDCHSMESFCHAPPQQQQPQMQLEGSSAFHRRMSGEAAWNASSSSLQRHPSMPLNGHASSSSMSLSQISPSHGSPSNGSPSNGSPSNGAPPRGSPSNGSPSERNSANYNQSQGRAPLDRSQSQLLRTLGQQKSLRSMGNQSLRSLGTSIGRMAGPRRSTPRQMSQGNIMTSSRSSSPATHAGSVNSGSPGGILVTSPHTRLSPNSLGTNAPTPAIQRRRMSLENSGMSASTPMIEYSPNSLRASGPTPTTARRRYSLENSLGPTTPSSANSLSMNSKSISPSMRSFSSREFSFPKEITPGLHFHENSTVTSSTLTDDSTSCSTTSAWVAFPPGTPNSRNGPSTPSSRSGNGSANTNNSRRNLLRASSEARLAMLARRNRSSGASSTDSTSSTLSSVSTPASDATPAPSMYDAKRNRLATSPKTVLLNRAFSGKRLFG